MIHNSSHSLRSLWAHPFAVYYYCVLNCGFGGTWYQNAKWIILVTLTGLQRIALYLKQTQKRTSWCSFERKVLLSTKCCINMIAQHSSSSWIMPEFCFRCCFISNAMAGTVVHNSLFGFNVQTFRLWKWIMHSKCSRSIFATICELIIKLNT